MTCSKGGRLGREDTLRLIDRKSSIPNQTSVVVKHCICYKLEQDRSSAAERMMGNNEPRCLSAKWQNMSWWRTWLISKSHSASTRGPLSCGRGKKGFHKISSANQQAGNDGHACGWADALPAETNPDIVLLPVSERAIKRPHQWVWLKYDTKNIGGPTPRFTLCESRGVCPFLIFNSSIHDRQMMLYWTEKLLFLWPPNFWPFQELLVSDLLY